MPHRTALLDGIPTHPCIELSNLGVGETRISFGKRPELSLAPECERVVGVERRASSAARLRIDHHGIDGIRLDFPLPPAPLAPTDAVHGIPTFQHQPFR